jgi:predicted dehydrogenase
MIRAAILGLGWWGKTIVRRMASSGELRIVAAVELDPARHAAFAEEFGLRLASRSEDVLNDPEIDAVILCTPNSMHTAQVIAAAEHGKHVFCEKPLALTRAEAERSVDACNQAGVVLGIGHERRFELGMMEVERMVRRGDLGTIMHAESNFSHDKLVDVPQGDWRRSEAESPAAGMTAMGIHLTDAYVNLFGDVESVFAYTANRVLDSENGDVVSVLVRFASGATGYLNAILATPHYLRLVVFGSKAWVEVRNDTHPDTLGNATLVHQEANQEPRVEVFEWTDSVRANLEAFAAAIRGERPYPFTDAQKIENIAVLEAITRSARTGQRVEVEHRGR